MKNKIQYKRTRLREKLGFSHFIAISLVLIFFFFFFTCKTGNKDLQHLFLAQELRDSFRKDSFAIFFLLTSTFRVLGYEESVIFCPQEFQQKF